jgi:dTDP-glucose 4,6-dehydratase
VDDGPGQVGLYSINVEKHNGLGWVPQHDCEAAIRRTVCGYVENDWWWRPIISDGDFREYYEIQYGKRKVLKQAN